MEYTKQLNHNHHAYHMHHNTSTALLQLTDSILEATDENMLSTLVTIDKSVAFDCVYVDILSKKLEMYKISKQTRNWIEDYMRNREQFIEIGTQRSTTTVTS